MLVGGIVAVVVVVGVLAAVVVRRRSHNDVHSVAHYHRSLHTLEGIQTHGSPSGAAGPAGPGPNGNGEAPYPANAMRSSGSSTVRLTESGRSVARPPVDPPPLGPPPLNSPSLSPPPLGPPPGADSDEPLRFDDSGHDRPEEPGANDLIDKSDAADESDAAHQGVAADESDAGDQGVAADESDAGDAVSDSDSQGAPGVRAPEHHRPAFMTGAEERAMHSINRRPRRLGAPAAAIGGVIVLIVVLVVAGMHSNPPTGHRGSGNGAAPTHTTQTTAATHHHTGTRTPKQTSTTTSTAPPAVSAPSSSSAHAATYGVSRSSYTLTVAATSSDCWVQATDTANGSVLFSATLLPGQSHAIAATGPLSVIAGAPSAFSATIDGTAIALPPGFQAPFTLTLQSPAGSPATGTSATGTAG